jgi:hypothetical protein
MPGRHSWGGIAGELFPSLIIRAVGVISGEPGSLLTTNHP